MFLRADRITIEFPLHALETGHAAATPEQLGGTQHNVNVQPLEAALEALSF
jgi:hypothetical protein